jgi:hypothetical protein
MEQEMIKLVPSLLWFSLALTVVLIFCRPIRDEVLPNLTGLKAMGVGRKVHGMEVRDNGRL